MAEHTLTPWTWRSFGSGLMLVNHRAHIVMDFVRKGMQGAEPRFGKRSDNMGGLMVPLSEWKELPPDAQFIVDAVNNHDRYKAALEAITNIAGNLTDERVEAVGGVNDARSRALMVVTARQIAKNALDGEAAISRSVKR